MSQGEWRDEGEGLAQQARRVLGMLVEWHSNSHHVATLAGIEPGYFQRVLEGERRLPDEIKDRALAAMQIDRSIYLVFLQGEDGFSPKAAATLLATCHEEPGLARDPFLGFLKGGVERWQAHPRAAAPPNEQRRAAILAMEHERNAKPRKAKVKIEAYLRALLAEDATEDLAGGDLALALAQWAVLRRLQGHRADARDAYLLAFGALAGQRDHLAEGLLFQWAAMLLDDFDRAEAGVHFCDRAARSLALVGDPALLGLCYLNRGLVLYGQDRFRAAEEWLQRALAHLGPRQQGCRFSARQGVALSQLALGEPRAAFATIGAAGSDCPDVPIYRAHLAWLEGRALTLLRQIFEAERRIEAALAVLDRDGEPLDAALASLDLARVYLRSGKLSALTDLMEGSTPRRIARLGANRRAEEILTDLSTVGLAGKLTETLLIARRKDLAATRRQPAYRRERVSRPALSRHKLDRPDSR